MKGILLGPLRTHPLTNVERTDHQAMGWTKQWPQVQGLNLVGPLKHGPTLSRQAPRNLGDYSKQSKSYLRNYKPFYLPQYRSRADCKCVWLADDIKNRKIKCSSRSMLGSLSQHRYEHSPYPEIDNFILSVLTKSGVHGQIRRWVFFTRGTVLDRSFYI